MANQRKNIIAKILICAFALLAAVGCGGGGGGTSSSSSSTIYQYVYDHNAYILGGYTVRWPYNPVSVGSEVEGTASAFNNWVSASSGGLRMTYGTGTGDVTVYYDYTLSSSVCGETTTYYNGAGYIVQAIIRMNPDQSRCAQGLYGTLIHEAAHALGFFGHDSDSIMNPTGSGPITTQNQQFFQVLYSLAAGTNINGYLNQAVSKQSSKYDPDGGEIYSITQRTRCIR